MDDWKRERTGKAMHSQGEAMHRPEITHQNIRRTVLALPAAILLSAVLAGCGDATPPTTEQRLTTAALQTGVTDLKLTATTDGGLSVTGKLRPLADKPDTVPFALRIPQTWNGQSVLEAHGYQLPQNAEVVPSPTGPAANPLGDPSFGLLSAAYAQGYAAANTAYAKTGYAVKEGVEANKALHDFLTAAGSSKQYMTGISMGGNITVALVEKYPNDFVGALPYCGVVAGWRAEQRYLLDFRVVYDYFTKGTAYALPGNGDATTPNAALSADVVTNTVVALFTRAAQNDAQAKAIVGQVARVAGTPPDPVSFITPLASTVYGLADYLATAGGLGYSNTGKVYTGSLNAAVDADLNAKVQRLTASAASSTFLDAHYTATGRFTVKMLSFHNTSDPLVPYSQETEFKAVVAAAGNSANLVQQIVQPKAVDNTATSGPGHCYFSQKEVVGAWNDLRNWVDNGVKPVDGKDITAKP
jgi:dienelactone hydrolase